MRKGSNFIVGALAAGVCLLITYITLDASRSNIIYNLCFLAAMLVIVIAGCAFGFARLAQTEKGLDHATATLRQTAMSGQTMAQVTGRGARLFGVSYYDAKYQEYLTYLHKTNSPADIGDYIGEYEINNYTHRRMLEMIPDLLTSLGILGTFVGLVLGLRGFNPTSYEAMSSSVEALIDGIKVAFVTSIYGLSLSLAFSWWLRGALSSVSESLDRFLDTYYTTAVPPTDATAMNHILANQNGQLKALGLLQQTMSELPGKTGEAVSGSIAPAFSHLNETMDDFTKTITLQQEQLLENISGRIARTMKQEFFSEFIEMRRTLSQANEVQKQHQEFMQSSEKAYQETVIQGQQRLQEAMESSAQMIGVMSDAMREQEDHLTQFVADMKQSMSQIAEVNDTNLKMTQQMERLSEMNGAVAGKMAEISELSERYTKTLQEVQSNNSDLSEGLSVMNDANIRISGQLSEMNSQTVQALSEAQTVQKSYLDAADGYLKSIQQAQTALNGQTELQQKNLSEFTEYMTKVLERMELLTENTEKMAKEASDALTQLSKLQQESTEQKEDAQLSQIISLLQEREKRETARAEELNAPKKRRGLFGR